MRKTIRKVVCGLLSTIMCFGLLATIRIDVKAAEPDKVDINVDYLYVKTDGSNGLVSETVSVDVGKTWEKFFSEKTPNVPSDLMGGGTLKTVGVQRVFSAPENISDTIKQEEIKKFNQYLDYALLEYCYYPDSYKEIDFCFEYFEGNVLTDAGTGWKLLVPAGASDEETLRYICDNFTVYEYLRNITNVSGIKMTVSEINTDYYCLSLSVPGTSSGEACDTPKTQESKPESEPVEEVVEEPTAETIADPSKAVNFIQATNSINMSIDKIASDVKEGKIQNNTPANINLGRYHSLSVNTITKLENVNVDVILKYQYKGKTYTVKIPKGYKFNKSIPWYGPLFMYQLFGQSVE